MSLEESRNPLAKGLLSIFNLVIWEHRKEQHYTNSVLEYCSIQSVNQSIPCEFTANFIPMSCLCAAPETWQNGGGKPGCTAHMAVERPKGMAGSAFLLTGAGGAHPWQHCSFQILCQHQSGCLFHKQYKSPHQQLSLLGGAAHQPIQTQATWAMASHHYHLFFFFWDGNVLSRACQKPHKGSLTGFVWKEDEEEKQKCGENSDLKWQSLDWRSNPTETITVLKNHRSWIKTFFPSSKVAINLPSHSVIPSILTEQPIDQESLLSKTSELPFVVKLFRHMVVAFNFFLRTRKNKCTIVLVTFSVYPMNLDLLSKTWDM